MSPTTSWTAAAVLAVIAILTLLAGDRLNAINERFDRAVGGRSRKLRPRIIATVLAVLSVVFALLAIIDG